MQFVTFPFHLLQNGMVSGLYVKPPQDHLCLYDFVKTILLIQPQPATHIKYIYHTSDKKPFPSFHLPTLIFPFGCLRGLGVDLFGRLPLLMEWLWLSWLPLTPGPWFHRAMALLCQDKVKDHSMPCTGPALLLIKQARTVQALSAHMQARD